MGSKPVEQKAYKMPQSNSLLSSCDEGYLQTQERKLNQRGSGGEFLRSGRQDFFLNTHETEILSCKDIKAGLGGSS